MVIVKAEAHRVHMPVSDHHWNVVRHRSAMTSECNDSYAPPRPRKAREGVRNDKLAK